MADPDLELKGGGGVLDLLALLAFSLQSFLLFLPTANNRNNVKSKEMLVTK